MGTSTEKKLNDELLLKEYDCLRVEMNESVKETRLLERNAVFATAALWSWLALKENSIYNELIWLPSVLVFLFIYRVCGLIKLIDAIGKYLKEIEKWVFKEDLNLGFERHMHKELKRKRNSAYYFWAALFMLTILIPLYFEFWKD